MAQSKDKLPAVKTKKGLTKEHAKQRSKMVATNPQNHVNQNPSNVRINDMTDRIWARIITGFEPYGLRGVHDVEGY
jgi:hypothetical protein